MTSEDHVDPRTASELRHRMANTFQLMSALARMRSQKASDPESRRQLVWMADSIGSLGALERHRRDGGLDFTAYLEDMIPVWQRRQGALPAEIHLSCAPMLTTDQSASTLALIAQELVANALIHAYQADQVGAVRVSLQPLDGDRYAFQVADDGRGFDPQSSSNPEHFGLWFVRSLAAQVRGQFSMATTPGVVARLEFTN